MGALTVRRDSKADRRADVLALPSLLEFHSPTAALSVVPIKPGARAINGIVCTLVVACFAAGGLIPVDKVVAAMGKIVPEEASSVIQPLETAIIRSINVREGQTVKQGQVLARLDPTFASADAGALRASTESLQAEVDRLRAEATSADYRPATVTPLTVLQSAIFTQRKAERSYKMEGYNQKISSLQAQIQRAMSDVAAYSERVKLATELESKRVELEKLGVGSIINRMAATDSKVEVMRGLDAAKAQAAQGARDMQAMQADRDGYDQNWRSQVIQDLTDQSRKLSDAKENLAKADRRSQLTELTAPQDSVVNNIAKVSVGTVLQPGEQLMTLTPVDAPLQVEVNVPANDSAFVHVGNPVNIKLESLPSTQYGGLEGTVRSISPDSYTSNPDDRQRGVSQQTSAAAGQAYYRARISIDENKLHDTPQGFRPVPGMPVTADVKVGKRTVLSYLLSRVLPVAMDGMREP